MPSRTFGPVIEEGRRVLSLWRYGHFAICVVYGMSGYLMGWVHLLCVMTGESFALLGDLQILANYLQLAHLQ